MADEGCSPESKIPSPGLVRALAMAALSAALVAARLPEYTRSALNAPAPAAEFRSTPCVPAPAVLMVRSARSVLLPSVSLAPLPLTVIASDLAAAAAPVAAVPALLLSVTVPPASVRLELAACD